MPILKNYTENFVALPNDTARDPRLSLEALGALARLASHSDNFEFKVEWLQSNWGLGREKIQRILRELREAGYYKTVAIARDDGTFCGHEWHISVRPIFKETAKTDESPTDGATEGRENRPSENPTFYKKEGSIKKQKDQDTHSIRASDFSFPILELIEAFPDIELTPAQVGAIESEVKEKDAEAWHRTIEQYKLNYDPFSKTYDPRKVGTVINVFRSFQVKLAKQNANNNGQTDERNSNANGSKRIKDIDAAIARWQA